MVIRNQENVAAVDTTDEAANVLAVAQRQVKKTIAISSSETLEMTVTSTGIEVTLHLGFLSITWIL